MQFAIVGDGQRIEAMPGTRGVCPICESEVIARCGDINAWHWAHTTRFDCDAWAEGESTWHRAWKKRFPRQWREVVVGSHRADIKAPRGVIELQASTIATNEVAEREHFYGDMVWVLNAMEFNMCLRDRGTHVTFRWKHPRKTWWTASKPLYFDLGDRLLAISRIHESLPCGGSGRYISYSEFVDTLSRPKPGEQLCVGCKMPYPSRHLINTGAYEYYTMDIDLDTTLCPECYERRRESCIPDDPSLFDCLTPVQFL